MPGRCSLSRNTRCSLGAAALMASAISLVTGIVTLPAGLLLRHMHEAVADMAAAEPDHIGDGARRWRAATPTPAGLRPDRIGGLEVRDL